MSVNSTTTITMKRTGDLNTQDTKSTATNQSASGADTLLTLSSGFTSITFPAGGSVPTGVIIVPPAGNTQTITLKGVTGDTGVALHPTDPSYISLASGAAFGITAGGTITGLRLIWQ